MHDCAYVHRYPFTAVLASLRTPAAANLPDAVGMRLAITGPVPGYADVPALASIRWRLADRGVVTLRIPRQTRVPTARVIHPHAMSTTV